MWCYPDYGGGVKGRTLDKSSLSPNDGLKPLVEPLTSIHRSKKNVGVFSLENVDFTKYRFRLVDNLDVISLFKLYSWIYEAEISGAVIGIKDDVLTWYSGTWQYGRWFGGNWISGTWIDGDWYTGNWYSKLVKDNYISVEVDDKSSNSDSSFWMNGRWYDGTWDNGTWANGRWYDGTWNSGIWYNGIWNDGLWKTGQFTGGIWVLGTWDSGIFNTLNGPSYWLDGAWNSGDFENGMWYTGTWDQKTGQSRFGTKSYASRASIWHGGRWVNGNFHSRLNTTEDGLYDVSYSHKYSIWNTGVWSSGDFYGGVAYNMDFKSGIWYGGIVEDIAVIGMTGSYFVLDGIFKFNIGDEITVIDNNLENMYSSLGSNYAPGKYIVLYTVEDLTNNWTNVYVNANLSVSATPLTRTGLRVVSHFRSCNWRTGIWTNGIYEHGTWESGIWLNGIFSATWM